MVDKLEPTVFKEGLKLVLDTHVVFDLWLFADPRVTRLKEGIESGALRWCVTDDLQQEASFVAARPWVLQRGLRSDVLWHAWSRYAQVFPEPAEKTEPAFLVCRDRSDQRFIRLAVAVQADFLLSYDRDLLALRRRAHLAGFVIERPDRFCASAGSAATRTGPVDFSAGGTA